MGIIFANFAINLANAIASCSESDTGSEDIEEGFGGAVVCKSCAQTKAQSKDSKEGKSIILRKIQKKM